MTTFDSPGVVASRQRLAQAANHVEATIVQDSLEHLTYLAGKLAADPADPHGNIAAGVARDLGMTPAEARVWVQRQIDADRRMLARLTGQPMPDSLAQRVNVGVAPDLSYCKGKYRGASLED